MRRIVLFALIAETILALVIVYGALTDRSDPAGRGYAALYMVAVAVPVALAIILFLLGWTRVAGVALLIVPALAVMMRVMEYQGVRQVAASRAGEGWFTDPAVLALSKAIAEGDTAAMRSAVAAKPAIVNAIADGGDGTILTHTVLEFPQMTEPLLALGADPSLVAPNGMSPLVAAVTKDPFAVRALLEKGADPNVLFMREPVIFNAFRTGRRAEALMLATQGADVKLRGERGETTALAAAKYWMFDVAAVLVDRGADPLAADSAGNTLKRRVEDPDLAAYHDDRAFQQLVETLKKHGVEVKLAATTPNPAPQ